MNVKDYPDLPSLIRALKHKYHDGKLYPMAAKIGVALGTVQQWENGMIKNPQPPTLRLLSRAYGLNFNDLVDMTSPPPALAPPVRRRRRRPVPIRGGSAVAQLPAVDAPSGSMAAAPQPVANTSIKSRCYETICKPRPAARLLRMATRLHRDYLVGSEALIACAA